MKKIDAAPSPELVFLGRRTDEPYTTSDIIAEHTGNSYRSIQRTIERQMQRLERFGRVRFLITPLQTRSGVQDHKIFHLNEAQATLLITFLKNTDIVADFKVELVRQFFEMRRLLQERQSEQWQQARSDGKAVRRMETDAIKAFVEYAADNGSKHPERYYLLFTSMVYRLVGTESGKRDLMSADALRDLRMAEHVVKRAIQFELEAETEYHEAFQNVKAKVRQIAALTFAPVLERVALGESA